MVMKVNSLQLMEEHGGADTHSAAHGRPQAGPDVYALKEAAAHAGVAFLAGTVAHGEPMLEQSDPEGLCHMERIHAGAVLEQLQPIGGTLMQFVKDCVLWEGPHAEAGEQHREEAAEMKC